MECKHWKDCNIIGGGCCSLGLYGGQPSLGVCNNCPKRVELTIFGKIKKSINKIKGMGDVVEKITEATGIKKRVEKIAKESGKSCGCGKRKEKLNKILPNPLSEE
jgi:hypothetical protein